MSHPVIPGRRAAASPESLAPDAAVMDFGLLAALASGNDKKEKGS